MPVISFVSFYAPGMVRCGAVRCGAVRCGAVRCGAVRCGAVRCGAVRCGTVRYGTVRYGTVQYRHYLNFSVGYDIKTLSPIMENLGYQSYFYISVYIEPTLPFLRMEYNKQLFEINRRSH
jgi:hypothetical protein